MTTLEILATALAFLLGPAIAFVLFRPILEGFFNLIERVVLAVIRIFGGRWKEAWADPDLEFWRHLKTRAFSTGDFWLEIVVEPDSEERLRKWQQSNIEYIVVTVTQPYITERPDETLVRNTNVVDVDVALESIGYLKRDDVERYRKAMDMLASAPYIPRCRARLAGGDRCESIRVWLDLYTPKDLEAALHDPKT